MKRDMMLLDGHSDNWLITWMWHEQLKAQDVTTLGEVPLHHRLSLALRRANLNRCGLTLGERAALTSAWGHRTERLMRVEREWLDSLAKGAD